MNMGISNIFLFPYKHIMNNKKAYKIEYNNNIMVTTMDTRKSKPIFETLLDFPFSAIPLCWITIILNMNKKKQKAPGTLNFRRKKDRRMGMRLRK